MLGGREPYWIEFVLDDETRRARAIALSFAVDVARDRGQATGSHPGADAVLTTAGQYADFIINGGKQ